MVDESHQEQDMGPELSGWQLLLCAVVAALAIAWLVYTVKHQPEAFTMDKLNQSMYTMGILALLLIGFVAFCVLMLRAT